MRRPRAIFFDLDDTLIDDHASTLRSLTLVLEQVIRPALPGIDLDAFFAGYRSVSDAYWESGDVRTMDQATSRLYLWRQTLTNFGHDDEALALQARDTYTVLRDEKPLLFNDALPLLAHLHGRYPLAVITNGGSAGQSSKMSQTNLTHLFEAIVTSDDFGVSKPDPAIFHHAAECLGVLPADAWHIGDSRGNDIKGALAADLGGAVWLNRSSVVSNDEFGPAHAEIATLSELRALLEAAE
jgi:putative hydrolase of the HAD superfamily